MKKNRLIILLSFIVLMFTQSAYCDITNDVTTIKSELTNLRKLLKDKYTTIYLWNTGAGGVYGTQNAIVTTLFNVAKGLKESILPAIQNLGVATNQLESIYNNLQDTSTYIQNINSNIEQIYTALGFLRSDLSRTHELLEDIRSELYNVNDHLTSIVGYIAEISNDFNNFIITFDEYKSTVTDYLRSIESNVSTIASNQQSYLHYISDIYSYLQGGINVSVTSGFPELKDYTAYLEKISQNAIWEHYTDWFRGVPNKWTANQIRYWDYDTLSTNSHVVQGNTLSGDFFTDSVALLSNSDTTLADISKSLMILVQQSSSNNVSDVDIDKEAEELTPTDKMDDPTNIAKGLSFPSSSGYLTLPEIGGLSNKQLPSFIDMEFPHLFGNQGGGTVSINVGKFAAAFTTMRNIFLFFYWGVTACLFVLLYRLFSKYVLGSLMKLAFSFVQKGKAV